MSFKLAQREDCEKHSRSAGNGGAEPASVLIVSAPRSSGYEPMEWA